MFFILYYVVETICKQLLLWIKVYDLVFFLIIFLVVSILQTFLNLDWIFRFMHEQMLILLSLSLGGLL